MTKHSSLRRVVSEGGKSSAEQPIRSSVFAVIGPIMTGPSSSHTHAPLALGNLVYQLIRAQDASIDSAVVTLHGSFAKIERTMGEVDPHGSKHAIVAGLLGRNPGDPIRDALDCVPPMSTWRRLPATSWPRGTPRSCG